MRLMFALLLCAVASSSCATASNSKQAATRCDPGQGVEIIVANPEHSGSMDGARVFVLASDGKELASATVDSQLRSGQTANLIFGKNLYFDAHKTTVIALDRSAI